MPSAPDEPVGVPPLGPRSQEPGREHARDPEDDMPLAELDARARADAALRRIRNGADPAREAFDLANTMNDEAVGRLRGAVLRWLRRD
ncbi:MULTISPECIES: hypothetical protein [unclassified Curtobacterium]|jgi:hypothetical protein|uniref:hypothetical protein n=1 Tax=unclassified Curtobacterium TaxID=257496 RepID=UPI00052A3FFD|nr:MULTISPECIES: hypothetical protein [unclassified Curtobacterium]AIV39475.1 hypothetical protein NI26_03025 [Curtobacterium sp. MR_MD2014]MBP1301230.1 hypothetical protein [Curtobacterium sp. 1310]MCM3522256.1 hypothetical protein [Curtobacterium sp. P97]MDB6427025.1 hypothetical protein [Curtobacterium sp. 20TX0008]MDT0211390.1 hypothetical protein [Curtobacterium sp. BRD11]